MHSTRALIDAVGQLDHASIQSLDAAAPTGAGAAEHGRRVDAARMLYRARRWRDRLFGDPALFGEPGWDLLLDLYLARADGKRVPVTSACIGAAVPTTTALRWLGALEEQGLITRQSDNSDARRVFVELSDRANAAMDDWLSRYLRGIEPVEVTPVPRRPRTVRG